MKIKNKSISTIALASLISPSFYSFNVVNATNIVNPEDFITINNIEIEGDGNEPKIIPTSDGGYLMIYIEGNHVSSTSDDGVVDKYNSKGVKEWTTGILTRGQDALYSAIELENGNFFAVGRLGSNTGTESISGYIQDGLIGIEINKDNGEIISARGLDSDNDFGTNSVYDSVNIERVSDGFIMYPTGVGSNIDLVKYNDNFVKQWEKSFTGRLIEGVTITDNEDIIMLSASAGFYESPDAHIQKYSKTGDELLNLTVDKKAQSSDSGTMYFLSDIIELNDGSYVAVGNTNFTTIDGLENQGKKDSMILRISSTGEVQSTKGFGVTVDDEANEIISTKDGGYMVLTSAYNKDIITKFDSDLNVQWNKEIMTNTDVSLNVSNRIITLKNGAIVVAGVIKDENYNGDLYTFTYQEVDKILKAVEEVEANPTEEAMVYARRLVNEMPEGDLKEEYQVRLNVIVIESGSSSLKNATANVDIYIKSENMLKLSLDTNSITFEDFSGVDDIEEPNAVNLTVSSSLPYKVDAYLATEIQNATKDKNMDKEILKIKANEKGEDEYASFTDVNITPITLLDDQVAGNDIVHGVDLKLVGGDAYEKDNYKTTIKFEVVQK